MLHAVKYGLLVSVLLAGTMMLPAVREFVFPLLAEWLDVGDNPICVDYVMVLPGEVTNRSLTAAALVRAGLAQEVLLPRSPHSADVTDGMTPPTAQLCRRILRHRGIPNERIGLIGSASRTTFDDAQALSEFLGNQDVKVAVVTSEFHTRRTRFTFGRIFGESAGRITIIAAPNPGFQTDRWWQQREGMRLILMEYLKLGFYHVRYGGIRVWALVVVIGGGFAGWRLLTRRGRHVNNNTSETQPQGSGDAATGRRAATGS